MGVVYNIDDEARVMAILRFELERMKGLWGWEVGNEHEMASRGVHQGIAINLIRLPQKNDRIIASWRGIDLYVLLASNLLPHSRTSVLNDSTVIVASAVENVG